MKSAEADHASVLTAPSAEDDSPPGTQGTAAKPLIIIGEPAGSEPRPFHFEPSRAKVARAGRLGSWHLPRGQSLRSLCETLNSRGVRYVALPAATGDGPALLVSDDDVPRITDLITRVPLGEPLAVYATTDLAGFAFQQHWRTISDATNMAVLPPYLAESLLAQARLDETGIRFPAPNELLLWRIYCFLYLSGDAHFAADDGEPVLVGAAAQTIAQAARRAAVNLPEPLTLAALHDHLDRCGWAASHDVLRRLACWNSWAASKVAETDAATPPEEPGVVAFFVRRQVFALGLQDDVSTMLEACGFELLATVDLDEEEVQSAARASRGANWGPGGFRVSGGPPARIIFAFDVMPERVDDALRPNYPYLDNGRVLAAKQFCRGLIRDRLPKARQFNPLHSTDDSRDAWRIVRLFAADREAAMRDTVAERKAEFATKFEVVRDLSRVGVRAKIELIRYHGKLAVKKTFRRTCLRFMEREIAFMDAVSPHRPEILPVIERGPNYFVTPFVEGRAPRIHLFGMGVSKLLTMRQVREIADLLRYLFAQGYDPIDMAPHNLLVQPSGRLTVIDFEFVHRTDRPVEPERSACLNGIPENFEGDWPLMARWCPAKSKALTDPYGSRWYGHTGLTRESFLNDPPSVQRLKRLVNYPAYLCSKAIERQTQWVRNRLKLGLKSRLPVLTRMAARAFRSRAIRS